MAPVREVPISRLAEVAAIPTAYLVESVLRVEPVDGGLGGFALTEEPVAAPWMKDNDAVPGHRPADWPARFDVSGWGLLAAGAAGDWTGAAVVAVGTPGLQLLRGRPDVALLWDLRVRPDARRRGTGARLFHAAADWARLRGRRTLAVETQNVNVPACRFYRRMGCSLATIDMHAYPELPGEAQLIWTVQL